MAKAKLRSYPVEVTWHDATSRTEWHTLDAHQSLGPLCVKSVGYLTKRDAKTVQIVQSWREPLPGDPEIVADSLTIPAGWVRRVRRLR